MYHLLIRNWRVHYKSQLKNMGSVGDWNQEDLHHTAKYQRNIQSICFLQLRKGAKFMKKIQLALFTLKNQSAHPSITNEHLSFLWENKLRGARPSTPPWRKKCFYIQMGKYEIRGSKGVLEVMEKFKRVYIRPEGFIESESIQTSITIFSPFLHNL